MPYMGELKQSTQVTKTILMVDSSDHITGKTGLTITKYLTKAGGTPAAATMTTSELDSTNVKGIYSLVFTTSHTDTLGDFQLHLTASGADPADYWWTVVARLNDDLAFPATSGRSMVVDANGLVDANTVKLGPSGSGTAQTARDVGASVLLSAGTGAGQIALSSGAVTVGTNNDKTGYSLTVAPLDAAGVRTAVGLASANLDTQLDALPTAAENASQVRTELTTELGRIDAAITTRSTLDAAGIRTAVGLGSANLDTQLSGIQSDTNDIQSRIPAALSVSGNLKADVKEVNDVTLTGDGSGTPWGPV